MPCADLYPQGAEGDPPGHQPEPEGNQRAGQLYEGHA